MRPEITDRDAPADLLENVREVPHEHARLVRRDQVIHRRWVLAGVGDDDLVDLVIADDLSERILRSKHRDSVFRYVGVTRHETRHVVFDLDGPKEITRGAPRG